MRDLVLAADLGTSGCKAALYDAKGSRLVDTYVTYRTTFPAAFRQEQRPEDWWRAMCAASRSLIRDSHVHREAIRGIALSGQSLALVPLDPSGNPLLRSVPIWSDARADHQSAAFFERIPEERWYLTTGNGFPPALYTLFKLMWLRDVEPDVFGAARTILGSKDYLNFRLTGEVATDPSYASGSGAYDLEGHRFDPALMDAAEIRHELWPQIRPATTIVGNVRAAVADAIGVLPGTPVAVGGVDNACMTLGAKGSKAGRIFGSLGSSDWITVAAERPVLDVVNRPYVFDHVVPGLYASAESTFGGGSSLSWIRGILGTKRRPMSARDLMALARQSPPGARGLICVPVLAGGTVGEGGPNVRGALVGLDLSHTAADIARAFLEGASLALRGAMDRMLPHATGDAELLLVGGGSLSDTWRTVLADVLQVPTYVTTVDQQAATLGAAALAWVSIGTWSELAGADAAHTTVARADPSPAHRHLYDDLFAAYESALAGQRDLADRLTQLRDSSARRAPEPEGMMS